MTVAQYTRPNYTTQAAAAYKANIDAAAAVFERKGDWFAPHQQDVGSPAPELSIRLDAGWIWDGTTLTEVAAQTVSGFTIPTAGMERVDRVVVDSTTGVASLIAGTAVTGSPSATAPAITAGTIPICQVRITSADTAVLNSMITDERVHLTSPASAGVSSAVAGVGITVSGATGAVTISQDIYTGSTASNLAFPVGSYVLVTGDASASAKAMNSSVALYLCTLEGNANSGVSTAVSGTALTGTWRKRGEFYDAAVGTFPCLYQRTA